MCIASACLCRKHSQQQIPCIAAWQYTNIDTRPIDEYCLLYLQASTSVQHLVLPCHWTQRSTIVADMIKSHGCAGRSIVFTDTKKDANELTASLSENCGAMALHGDIPQVGTPYKSAHFHKILHFFPTNSQASQKCSCSQITKFVQCCLKVFADV